VEPGRSSTLENARPVEACHSITDLGPFRCISARALDTLGMTDRSYGWTVEMQALALRDGLTVLEVPVRARVRRGGASKISGRFGPVLAAGWCILTTIVRVRLRSARRMPLAPISVTPEAPLR
jgi:hypothetical protein